MVFSDKFVTHDGQSGSPAGGARRDRTDDLLLAKQALSQLSYGPAPARATIDARHKRMVGLGRLELPTSRLSSARSNQLSYRPREHTVVSTRLRRAPTKTGARCSNDLRKAWARPRRKRNEDGEVPPMDVINSETEASKSDAS